jgi:ubiquinone/menaquinone biosynthesis C-methylase UbiE
MSGAHPYGLIPALRFRWLTPAYDLIVRLTTRESSFKAVLVAQLALPREGRVLDLGCGTATLTLLIKSLLADAEVHGVDGDPDILRIARAKAFKANLPIELRQGMAQALPYPDERFDCVVSSLFFHHLDRPGKLAALAEAHRVLKPGGELHIVDWGRATGLFTRAAFFSIQVLDGFPNTADNVRGLLPELMVRAGFESARETRRFLTMYGNLALYRAEKPAPRRG